APPHPPGGWAAPPPAPARATVPGAPAAALAPRAPPPRPRGRLWLLRPVGPFTTVAAVLDHLDALAAAAPSPDLPSLARTELAALHESF
ncbi:hypothetical protein ACFVZX_13930, partial [Streptomyces erythrochromogenes]